MLTGIIKISLKTFLECVRLRTFGRYGLQQIQVRSRAQSSSLQIKTAALVGVCGGLMAKQLGSRDINQKVVGLIPGCAK